MTAINLTQQQNEESKQYSRGPPAFLYSLSGAGPLGPPSEGPAGNSESSCQRHHHD